MIKTVSERLINPIIVSVTLLALLINGCSKPSANEYLIDRFYSKKEIEELDKITNFVINEMSKDCDGRSVDCLYQYFDKFKELRAADDIQVGFSMEAQKVLIESLDERLFYDIWGYLEVEKSTFTGKKVSYSVLAINTNGRFSKFIAELTSENESVRQYGESLSLAGGFTPYMDATLLKQSERFKLESRNEMLIVAIHLFTLNYFERLN